MQKSESIKELAAALAKAQGEMTGAKKDSTNPHFRSKYADLASVWEACRGALSSNGISVVQAPDSDDPELMAVTTVLMHSSGEWMSSRFVMRPVKGDPQGLGSAGTYARRYALAAMVCVAPEDDDGEGAQGRAPQSQPVDIKAKAEAQHQAYAALKAAVDAGDALGVWAVRIGDEGAYRAAHALLDTKGKKAAKELEVQAPDLIKQYATTLDDHADLEEDMGVEQAWGELSKPGKLLVWAELEEKTKAFIKQLKKEAA